MFNKNKQINNNNNETKEKKPMSKGKKIAIGIAVLFVLAAIGSGGNDSKPVTNDEQNKQQVVDNSVQTATGGEKEKSERSINDLPAPTVEITDEEFIELLGTFFTDYNSWQKEFADNIDTYDSITAAEDFLQAHFDKIPSMADTILTVKTPEDQDLHFVWSSAYHFAFQSLLAYDEIQELLAAETEEEKNGHLQKCNYILTTVMVGYVEDVNYYLEEYAKNHQ